MVVVGEPENRSPGTVSPFHGDVLEAVFSHVPLVDLVSACQVSKSWKRAVFSSLSHFNAPKPWLFVHERTGRSPYRTATHAYDPRSQLWIEILLPPTEKFSALRSSHSSLIYLLSPSKLSFSSDPLHLTWHHAVAPLVWRTDPVVALVGKRIIVAGGTCDFEDDPLAVEVYDAESRTWETCESMPAILKDSAGSAWLSVATDDSKLFVTEKYSGMTHWFDPAAKKWHGPHDLRPDPSICYSVIGFCFNRLIMISLIGGDENVVGLNICEVNRESFECKLIGEMPTSLVEKLKGEYFHVSSIGVNMAGNLLYIHNTSDVDELFTCELVNGGCRWGSFQNAVATDRNRMGRFVFTCADVGVEELQRATGSENQSLNRTLMAEN